MILTSVRLLNPNVPADRCLTYRFSLGFFIAAILLCKAGQRVDAIDLRFRVATRTSVTHACVRKELMGKFLRY